jgi:25S rRNA (uracil2634-N3)-methyltransferase
MADFSGSKGSSSRQRDGDNNSRKKKKKRKRDGDRHFARKKKRIIPYCIENFKEKRIVLVVGDGDFSFSHALMKNCSASKDTRRIRIMATSYDSLREVGKKYADNCLEKLKSNYGKNVRVLHSVNATSLSQTLPEDLKKIYFDAVVFHYPHTGQQRTHLNRNLVRDFLSSAGPYIKPNTGEIHITLKQEAPYKFWNVKEFAEQAGLELRESLPFQEKKWPGYVHRTTLFGAKQVDASKSLTHIFTPGQSLAHNPKQARDSQAALEREELGEKRDDEIAENEGGNEQEKPREAKSAKRRRKKKRVSHFAPVAVPTTDDKLVATSWASTSGESSWGGFGSGAGGDWSSTEKSEHNTHFNRAVGKLMKESENFEQEINYFDIKLQEDEPESDAKDDDQEEDKSSTPEGDE